MDFFSAIEERRSCRLYTSESIPESVVQKALDAALLAPNSSNMQCWSFYWVRSAEAKSKLIEACLVQSAAKTAAELIVCVADLEKWRANRAAIVDTLAPLVASGAVSPSALAYYNKLVPLMYSYGPFNSVGYFKKVAMFVRGLFSPTPRGPGTKAEILEMLVKSCALACENLMLAFAAQGYGSCPMEGFDECRVKKLLGLGCKSRVVMVVSAGKVDPKGIWGARFRVPRDRQVHLV